MTPDEFREKLFEAKKMMEKLFPNNCDLDNGFCHSCPLHIEGANESDQGWCKVISNITSDDFRGDKKRELEKAESEYWEEYNHERMYGKKRREI